MQLVSYRSDRQERRVGILTDDHVIDIAAAASHHGIDVNLAPSMPALTHAVVDGKIVLKQLASAAPPAAVLDLTGVNRDAPILPSPILCADSNYRAHNSENVNTPMP